MRYALCVMRFIYTKTFSKIFTVFVVVALFVILDATGYIGWFKNIFFHGFGFVETRVSNATGGIKRGFSTVFTIKNLARDNAVLNQKIDELSFENARLKAASEENLALRKALNFKQQSAFNLLPVEALISDPTGFTQSIIINKGDSQAVRVNQPVVVAPGILIGKVTKVYSNSAEVTLLTDPSITINAEVADSGAKGLIRGQHGLALLLDLVTQNEVIKSGDSVITSGLANDFPRGLLIGQISAFRSNATDLFQKAYVGPAADLRNLRFLFVLQ